MNTIPFSNISSELVHSITITGIYQCGGHAAQYLAIVSFNDGSEVSGIFYLIENSILGDLYYFMSDEEADE